MSDEPICPLCESWNEDHVQTTWGRTKVIGCPWAPRDRAWAASPATWLTSPKTKLPPEEIER